MDITSVELIERSDGNYLEGYAIVFYDGTPQTEYKIGDFYERINRPSVEKVLREQATPVVLRRDHDKEHELDSTEGTLKLTVDDKGARFSSPYDPSDPEYQWVKRKLSKKLLRGCSFKADGIHRFERQGNKTIAWTDIVTLEDVSVVGKPAYKGTSALVRTEPNLQTEHDEWLRRLETEKRIEKLNTLA